MRCLSTCGSLALSAAVLLLGLAGPAARADDWPQWRGPQADGVWRETGIVQKFKSDRLERKWSVPIGAGYSGPTVAAGRVYVTDRLVSPSQQERVHCFDATTGATVWKFAYDCPYVKIGYQAGPRACVTIDGGKAYSLGAMGHAFCLDAADGHVIWKRDLNAEYQIEMPIWGIAASPVIYRNLVILLIGGTPDSCVVALDKETGKEVWRSLSERGQYATPLLVKQGEQDVCVCWTGDSVAGLDPATGKVLWREAWKPRNMPIGVATPIVDQGRVFLTSFYDGSLLLKLSSKPSEVEKVWQRVGKSETATDALQSIISTPLFLGDHIYGVDSYGELRCLDAKNGDRVWENLTATPKARWSTIHFVVNGDRQFLFNERGELIIAKLTPGGYNEISRAALIEPTEEQLRQRKGVCWSHPAYANKHVFARNDKELVCASLAE